MGVVILTPYYRGPVTQGWIKDQQYLVQVPGELSRLQINCKKNIGGWTSLGEQLQRFPASSSW